MVVRSLSYWKSLVVEIFEFVGDFEGYTIAVEHEPAPPYFGVERSIAC